MTGEPPDPGSDPVSQFSDPLLMHGFAERAPAPSSGAPSRRRRAARKGLPRILRRKAKRKKA